MNNAAVETAMTLFPKFLFVKSSSNEVNRVCITPMDQRVYLWVRYIYATDASKVAIRSVRRIYQKLADV